MSNTSSAEKMAAKIAARRPKISKEEAKRRREVSMRRFKWTDRISVIVLAGVLLAIQSQLFAAVAPGAPNEMLLNTTLLYLGVVSLQIAFIISASFMRYNNDLLISEDKSDHVVKGIRWTYFTPLIAVALLLPALFTGVFASGDMNGAEAAGFIALGLFLSIILAPLVSFFIIMPLMLIWKGMVAVVRGDKSQRHFGVIGLLIAGLAAFIIIGSAAVTAEAPFPLGSVQVVFAILGIPGNYQIENEVLLWILRGIALFYVVAFVYGSISSKQRKNPS